MSDATLPTEEQIKGFLAKLESFKGTLDPTEQKLLDAMAHAALGKTEENADEVAPYWAAVRGPYGGAAVRGPYGGVAVRAPYGGVVATPYVNTWAATPWGTYYY